MNPPSCDSATKMYRKSQRGLEAPVDLDDATAKVFEAIDGCVPLSIIAESTGVGVPVIWRSIAKLTRLGMIEEASDSTGTMGKRFAEKLHRELTKAIGPMSYIIIQNVAKLTKITWPHIPSERARELINTIVVQIPNDRVGKKFQETMLKEL